MLFREMVHAPDIWPRSCGRSSSSMTVHLPLRLFRCPGSGNRTTTPSFHLDPRVAEAEVDRRTRTEVERWYEERDASGTQAGFRTRSTVP